MTDPTALDAPSPSGPQPSEVDHDADGPYRILLVEDEKTIREAVAASTRRGYLRRNTIDTLSGQSRDDNLADGAPVTAAEITEKLYSRTRIHVKTSLVPPEEARQRIYGQTRKPVRFFDRRKG